MVPCTGKKQGSEILTNAIMGEKVFSEQNFLQEGMEELGSLIGGQIGGEKGAAIGNALGNVMYIAQDLLTGFMAEANFYEYLDKLNDGNKAVSIKEILEEAGYSTDVDDVEETLQDILNKNGIKSSLTEEEIKACEEAGLMMKADDAGKVDDVLDVIQEGGLNSNLLDELANSGVKYNAEDVVAVTKTVDGKLVWLENGTDTAGLNHIINEHASDFLNKGITQDKIANYVMNALENGKIVGYQGRGTGRPIYEFIYNGEIHQVAITVGDNGFVVGANPK